MSRIVVGQGTRGVTGSRQFTATLIELDDGQKVHLQLYMSKTGTSREGLQNEVGRTGAS